MAGARTSIVDSAEGAGHPSQSRKNIRSIKSAANLVKTGSRLSLAMSSPRSGVSSFPDSLFSAGASLSDVQHRLELELEELKQQEDRDREIDQCDVVTFAAHSDIKELATTCLWYAGVLASHPAIRNLSSGVDTDKVKGVSPGNQWENAGGLYSMRASLAN